MSYSHRPLSAPTLGGPPPRSGEGLLLVDVDDVLLCWIDGFRPFAENRLGRTIDQAFPNCFDLSQWLGVTRPEAALLVQAFNSGVEPGFSDLPAYDCAREVLPHIARSGYRIRAITSCSDDPRVIRMRQENLEKAFGPIFEDIACLPLGAPKGPELSRHAAATWVEDNHDNALAGADLGHDSLIMRRPQNIHIEETCQRADLTWVDDWHQIARHIGCEFPAELQP